MPWYQAFVLGLVQGFSEFLPISSSGHLLLTRWAFGWDPPGDESVEKAFDVALHFGTFMAVVAYFRHDLKRYVREFDWCGTVSGRIDPDGRIAWLLVVVMIPAVPAGVSSRELDRREARHPGDHRRVVDRVRRVALWWADQKHGERTIDQFHLRDR
ncbi:MAG: undecaprenyl-diphosphate phosphatase [Ilumatobacteraceae bacterium]